MYQNWNSYYMPRSTDNVFRIISILVVSFIVQWIASTFFYTGLDQIKLLTKLSLQFNENFNFFQIFSHPLLHGNTKLPWGILELLFTCLVLYFFGSELERHWGRHNFLRFFYAGLLGSICFGLLFSVLPGDHNYYYYGIAGGNAALLIAYAIFWPDRQILFMFFIPLKMKWFIVILFLMLALPGGSARLIQYIGGALAGSILLYYYARRSVDNSYGISTDLPSFWQRIKIRWQEYARKKHLRQKQNEIDKRIAIKAKVDKLLDKISKEGMKSLSRKEKQFLDEASEKY